MAEESNELGDERIPEGSGDEGGKKPPEDKPATPTAEQRLAEMEARLAAAERESVASRKDAEGAQAYLAQVLGSFEAAARSGTKAPTDEDRRATLDRMRERMSENPEEVLDEHFKSRMGPLYNNYLAIQDQLNKDLTIDRIARDPINKELWDKYSSEVDDFMKDMPLEAKVRPGAYDRAFRFVLANHLDEVADFRVEQRMKERERRERGSFVEGPSNGAMPRRQQEGLSDLEKQVARGLGMSDDDYRDWKGKNQYGA